MTYIEILKNINNGNISSLYLLSGEESYFNDKLVFALKEQIFKSSDPTMNFYFFYAEDVLASEIIEDASTFPFLGSRKLIVVNNIEKFSASALKEFLSYIENPINTTCLVFAGKKVDKRGAFFKEISKKGVVFEAKALYLREIKAWVSEELKNQGKRIETTAMDVLLNLVGNNLKNLEVEIEKLLLFLGEGKMVKTEDVINLVTPQKEYNHFELMESIANKDRKKALMILFSIIKEGKNYHEIISLLRWQLLRIIQGKELQSRKETPSNIGKQLRIPPYFLDKFLNQIKNFSKKELIESFEKLLSSDLEIKRSTIPFNIVLELLVTSICKSK